MILPMIASRKREMVVLLLGDIFFLVAALWLTLFVRYTEVPSWMLFAEHLAPFSVLFVISLVIFFIAGLYDKHTIVLKRRLPAIILNAEMASGFIAVLFFYVIPYFGITPKTTLFIYLLISFGLLLFWRLYGYGLLGLRKQQKAVLIGGGSEMRELIKEVNGNNQYGLTFVFSVDVDALDGVDIQEEIINRIYSEHISLVVIDLENTRNEKILPALYNLIFSQVQFIDMYKVYEDIFNRVPLSVINYSWFLENISSSSHIGYDILKRGMDLIIAIGFGLLTLIFYPFAMLAIWLEDRGKIFLSQERIGKGNRPVNMYKFRSMRFDENGVWVGEGENTVTRVGAFLRKTRIDEFPQLWSVIRGDLSFVGPRPDMSGLAARLRTEIPYYTIRNIIKPGLSGWAQINQEKPPHSIEETKLRLAYDIYYIKNRSFLLDIGIALRTIKTLLSRVGR